MWILKDELPDGFKSWNHFYQDKVKEVLLKHPNTINLKFQLTVSEERNYEFSIDFIKAKCFDEFINEWPKLCSQVGPWEQTSASWFEQQIENFLCITSDTRLL